RLLTESVPWPETGRARRAGVSSFGISGTNAHVILEAVPQPPEEIGPALPVVPWVLSAKSEPALRAQARRLLTAAPDHPVGAIARTLATGRAALEHRAAVVGANREELLAGLEALAGGSGVHVGRVVS
ncbi:ketoacyl-synthetase C-terminal extension domain-containing protein, partial [Microtetraspora sp. NBRC 16547]|uniref:ketoacyl-synthetase C-terminal extension domain-containing protein n=1 Tax=Microtetraspora sp. NBRC 16547 TaxID=3030993 RepID=UPI002556F5E5